MSLTVAKAEELIALTTKLATMIEHDIAMLKSKRPAALAQNESDRATLLLLYGKAAAEFRTGAALAPLPATAKQKLKLETERLHKAIKEQNRLLARFRHVTEGMIKAIADAVAARQTPAVYGKSGTFAKPQAPTRAAFTLNQSI